MPRVSEPDLDDERREGGPPDPVDPEERASTPFDHPYFLPALLIAFAAWFGYDGWLNPEFDKQWLSFNRYGFFVLLPLAAYFTVQAVRERRGGK